MTSGYFPTLEHTRAAASVGTTAGSTLYYVALPAPAGANTKSAWTTIIAATAFDVACLLLQVQLSGNAFMYADIGIGAAGSEIVVMPNLVLTRSSTAGPQTTIVVTIPLAIPAGTRVAMRFQHHSGGSNLLNVKLLQIAAGLAGLNAPQLWEDWGTDTANTQSTPVTSGAINTKGAWVTLKAATAFDTRWVFASDQSLESARYHVFDIGVGAAGAEQVLLPDLMFTNQQNGELYGPLPVTIPAGSRIAARSAAEFASSAPRIAAWGGGRG